MNGWERLREDEIINRLRRNVRQFILFIRLRGMDDPVPVAEAFTIKEVLRVLREYEEEYGQEIIEKFLVIED